MKIGEFIPLDCIELLKTNRAKQSENRELNFLGRSHDIFGIKVRAMTVMDFCILTHKQSPLLNRSNPSIADLSLFMLVLMPNRSLWRAWRLGKQIRRLNAEEWAMRCFEYVDAMLADFPAGNGKGESCVSFVAYWCHEMRKSPYHCTKAEVLAMPLPELFQCLRLLKQDRNPGAPESNRQTDEAINKILIGLKEGKFSADDVKEGRIKFN